MGEMCEQLGVGGDGGGMVAASDPTGLLSSAAGTGVPDMGLECFLDAPLPVPCQLHWGQ